MSVRSVFGPDINLPTIDEKFVYAVDGVAKLSGISVDGNTGVLNHVLSSNGDGRCRWRVVSGPGATPTLQEVCEVGNTTDTTIVMTGPPGISGVYSAITTNLNFAQPTVDYNVGITAEKIQFDIDSNIEGIHSVSLGPTQLIIDSDSGTSTQYLGKSAVGNTLAWRDIADGPVANYKFIPADYTLAEITVVAADSANNIKNYWSFVDEIFTFTRLEALPPAVPPLESNKFNFYCFEPSVNLNNMVVGQINGIKFDFTITDFDTGLPFAGVAINVFVFTKLKTDGTNEGAYYNSKITFDGITSNQTYQLDDKTPAPASQISSSFSPLDELFAIAIASNSNEPLINWVFTLNLGTVFTTGPVGPAGASGTVGIVAEDSSKNFNNWNYIGNVNGVFTLETAGPAFAGTTVTCYNNGFGAGTTLRVDGAIKDMILIPSNSAYSSVTLQLYCYATFICLGAYWRCVATNSSSVFA
jgi:hypothetical protein